MQSRNLIHKIVYRLLTLAFLSCFFSFSIPLNAQEESNKDTTPPVETPVDDSSEENTELQQTQQDEREDFILVDGALTTELESQLDSTRSRLASLMTTELRKELLLTQLQNELLSTELAEDRQQLETQIQILKDEIFSIREEFNRTLTGGIDQTKLTLDESEVYNWRTDLEEIMKPLFRSMKGVTEKPREIERLRSKIGALERNIELSQSALSFIQQLDSKNLPDAFLLRIQTAEAEWTIRLASIKEELKIVKFQLQTRLEESSNFFNNFGDSLKEFAAGRGFSILLAFFASGRFPIGFRQSAYLV